jgi:hypothetical protein
MVFFALVVALRVYMPIREGRLDEERIARWDAFKASQSGKR